MKKKNKEPISKFFKDNNYIVVTGAVPSDLSSFLFAYFKNKRTVCKYLHDNKEISPYDYSWGTWADQMIPDTYSHYGDVAMETLMVRMMPVIKTVTNIEVIPTYTYARIYKYGDILHRHKDRPSCEISCTINLGGDKWPIYLEPSGEVEKEGIQVNLNPGDMLVYQGCIVEHWREMFQGEECGQVFCHYVDAKGPYVKDHAYDSRPMIGLPQYTRRK